MTAAALGPIEEQLQAVQAAFAGATAVPRADGTTLVTIPGVRLPAGWNRDSTTVHFVVPVGFPAAKPDCFWADTDLRLADGQQPVNSNISPVPGTSQNALWFSWHVQSWSPVRDSLLTYVRVIQNRFLRGN